MQGTSPSVTSLVHVFVCVHRGSGGVIRFEEFIPVDMSQTNRDLVAQQIISVPPFPP